MRKEDIASAIVYLLMIALALIVGLTVISKAFTNIYNSQAFLNQYAFAIITIVVGLLFNIAMLEVCHIIGGKLGGYDVVSINMIGFCWFKILGKWQFKFRDFDGLTGETRLAPKSDKAKLTAFVWIPFLGYVIELVTCIILYTVGANSTLDPKDPLRWVAVAALLFIVISSMIALYNFVPVRLDSMTDGYRLMLISKPENVEALNELMRIENLQREGKEVDKVKIFDKITDFTANINLFSVYEELAKRNYSEAEKLIDMIIVDPKKVSETTYNRLVAQKLYIKIVQTSNEDAKKYYDENVGDNIRRFISNDLSMESLRAYVLIAGVLDDSLAEVEYANSRKEKAMKRALPARIKLEEELYESALNLVKEKHKDWEFKKPDNTINK